jgi:predicted PurR-regulated permease PerM
MEGLISTVVRWIEQNSAVINTALLLVIVVLLVLILLMMLVRAAQSGEIIKGMTRLSGSISTIERTIDRDVSKIREYTSQLAVNTKTKMQDDDFT